MKIEKPKMETPTKSKVQQHQSEFDFEELDDINKIYKQYKAITERMKKLNTAY